MKFEKFLKECNPDGGKFIERELRWVLNNLNEITFRMKDILDYENENENEIKAKAKQVYENVKSSSDLLNTVLKESVNEESIDETDEDKDKC